MTVNLELPQDLEEELSNEALELNISMSEYILRILSFRPTSQSAPRTGAELVAYWARVGAINSRPDIQDSQQHARTVRAQAQHRQ